MLGDGVHGYRDGDVGAVRPSLGLLENVGKKIALGLAMVMAIAMCHLKWALALHWTYERHVGSIHRTQIKETLKRKQHRKCPKFYTSNSSFWKN